MDIRMINKNNETINVTDLSIRTMGEWLVGMNDRGEIVQIERYENNEEARRMLEKVAQEIEDTTSKQLNGITIRT